jgi:threonine dehydrogenase-like Zn-dependent dehydrogenase
VVCGVCRTDLHILDGELTQPKLPLIPGHGQDQCQYRGYFRGSEKFGTPAKGEQGAVQNWQKKMVLPELAKGGLIWVN